MAAPLSDCTIEEQRAVVRFLWAEGVKFAEIHRRMLAQYGARTMHQRKIYEWIERFKEGRTSGSNARYSDLRKNGYMYVCMFQPEHCQATGMTHIHRSQQ
jgi:hypothetical protein